MDITNFMSWFLLQFVSLISWVFSTLDSITFFGTSLLKYSVGILVTGVIVDVMLSLVKARGMRELSHHVEKKNNRGVDNGEHSDK